VVLGVPIGSEAFTTAAIRAKLEIHVQHLDTLFQLQDSQIALPMLTRCYVQRPSYLARTVAPLPAEIELFHAFDERMLQAFASILGHPSFSSPEHSLAQSQVRLPISMGGVELRSVAETAPAAFLGGWALVASRVAKCFRTGMDTGRLSEAIGAVQTGDYAFQQRLRTALGLLPPAGQEALGEAVSGWAAGDGRAVTGYSSLRRGEAVGVAGADADTSGSGTLAIRGRPWSGAVVGEHATSPHSTN
jgi:hypothetical protein